MTQPGTSENGEKSSYPVSLHMSAIWRPSRNYGDGAPRPAGIALASCQRLVAQSNGPAKAKSKVELDIPGTGTFAMTAGRRWRLDLQRRQSKYRWIGHRRQLHL